MAIVDVTDIPDFLHTEATWDEYEDLLVALADRPIRVTFDRGQLEIMTPSHRHERGKGLLGRLLEALMNERRIVYEYGGSVLIHRKLLQRGLEPDESYWIANCRAIAGKAEYDPDRDPPPDLVVEVDVSRSSINRLGIYAAFGVPEVWRFAKDRNLIVYRLDGQGAYQPRESSPTFPDLPMPVLERFIEMGLKTTTAEAVWAFQDWLRQSPAR